MSWNAFHPLPSALAHVATGNTVIPYACGSLYLHWPLCSRSPLGAEDGTSDANALGKHCLHALPRTGFHLLLGGGLATRVSRGLRGVPRLERDTWARPELPSAAEVPARGGGVTACAPARPRGEEVPGRQAGSSWDAAGSQLLVRAPRSGTARTATPLPVGAGRAQGGRRASRPAGV